jgi:hypothetical protein
VGPGVSSFFRHVFENPATPAEIRAYQEWERRNGPRMQLRYADVPVASAFGVRPSDVVRLSRQVTLDFTGQEPRLIDGAGRHFGTLGEMPADLLRRFVAALDGREMLGAVCARAPFAEHAAALQACVGALLGGPFLVPGAIAELEARLRAIEVLRFPSLSPYTMPREYWENSIAVRQALGDFYAGLEGFDAFSTGLRGLHRLATLGANGTNYYGGAGGIATVPGGYRSIAIGNAFSERRQRLLKGWLRQLGSADILVTSGSIVSTSGMPLATIAAGGLESHRPYGRAGEELRRQLGDVHVHLVAARAAATVDRTALVRQCALFHHAFVHAHPFGNINNSIAMNVVNDLLGRAGVGVIPHLYFDQVALFTQPADYVRLFELGVAAHVISDEAGHDRPATRALLEAVTGDAAVMTRPATPR